MKRGGRGKRGNSTEEREAFFFSFRENMTYYLVGILVASHIRDTNRVKRFFLSFPLCMATLFIGCLLNVLFSRKWYYSQLEPY